MKTKGLVATAILVGLLLPTIAAARLGETVQECDRRYGTPTKVEVSRSLANSIERTYSSEGFTILVLFINGRAEEISYSNPAVFTNEEISTLLRKNASGETWGSTPSGRSSVYGSWETPKGATAEYFKLKPWESPAASSQYCLEVRSSTLARLAKEREAEKQQQEQQKAEAEKQKVEAAKQREEQERRERLKRLDKF